MTGSRAFAEVRYFMLPVPPRKSLSLYQCPAWWLRDSYRPCAAQTLSQTLHFHASKLAFASMPKFGHFGQDLMRELLPSTPQSCWVGFDCNWYKGWSCLFPELCVRMPCAISWWKLSLGAGLHILSGTGCDHGSGCWLLQPSHSIPAVAICLIWDIKSCMSWIFHRVCHGPEVQSGLP